MMVWTIDFAEFGVALIAGIDRTEKSHVTAFVEKHGDHSFQHVALQVSDLDALSSALSAQGVNLLGDTLTRKEAGATIKQVFASPFHADENSSVVGFYEFVERSPPEQVGAQATPEITFSEKAGTLLYEQAQAAMVEGDDRRVPMSRFSKMPPAWEPPEPRPDRARQGDVEITRGRGRREHDGDLIGEIHRWKSYRRANDRFPRARAAELEETCRLASVRGGETVAEFGVGSGLLTFPIAAAAAPLGRVFGFDVSSENLVSVMLANETALPIIPVQWSPVDSGRAAPDGDAVDCVVTLATFHHFDNRSMRTGTRGRQTAAAAFHRLLKRGGRLVIGDVAGGTPPQRYFDAIDDPRYCYPNGHPHDFLTASEMKELLEGAGFTEVVVAIRSVPWVFASKDEAVEFLGVMHNAKCSPEEVRALVDAHLRFDQSPGRCVLQWELLFAQARKC